MDGIEPGLPMLIGHSYRPIQTSIRVFLPQARLAGDEPLHPALKLVFIPNLARHVIGQDIFRVARDPGTIPGDAANRLPGVQFRV
jgi:hypothetical protein